MWFELEIRRPGIKPIRDVFQGQTVEWAIFQASRAHPGAVILVPEESAKAVLSRSSDGPKKAFQRKSKRLQKESRS